MRNEYMNYMGHHWILVEDNTVLVGMSEEAMNEIDKIQEMNLPSEGEEVVGDEVCGEIETPDGTYKLYSPVDGNIVEVNQEIIEDNSLLFDDPYESWLYRVEASDSAQVDALFEDSKDVD
jgi:glycine cleavage system H protein